VDHPENPRTIGCDELLPLHHGEPDPEERLVGVYPIRPEDGDVKRVGHEGTRKQTNGLLSLLRCQGGDRNVHGVVPDPLERSVDAGISATPAPTTLRLAQPFERIHA
jgi:hypothetical protein